MANAMARVDHVENADAGGLVLVLSVVFSGAEVGQGQGDVRYVHVPLDAADQPAAMRAKMSAAVVAEASAQGWVLAPASLILPSFQKGV